MLPTPGTAYSVSRLGDPIYVVVSMQSSVAMASFCESHNQHIALNIWNNGVIRKEHIGSDVVQIRGNPGRYTLQELLVRVPISLTSSISLFKSFRKLSGPRPNGKFSSISRQSFRPHIITTTSSEAGYSAVTGVHRSFEKFDSMLFLILGKTPFRIDLTVAPIFPSDIHSTSASREWLIALAKNCGRTGMELHPTPEAKESPKTSSLIFLRTIETVTSGFLAFSSPI
mmetsp:Transcript_12220/g.18323  ORF Transcript_12220/g.18323 Transcript_12220/m.18323 type:complete len:227 (+) Transcript_12220:492-1172(+)